jgi:hypothetical protein
MDRILSVASFLGFLTAAALWWKGHHASMFVAATLGAVCWFLSIRVKLRRITQAADAERERQFADAEDNHD